VIVQKFGGSSVADAERIRRVGGIVSSYKSEKPVVVVSALRGVTDELLALAQEALRADFARLRPLKRRHLDLARQLRAPAAPLEALFSELELLCRGVSLLKELTPRTLDYAASFGERLSARIVAGHLTKTGTAAEALDAGDHGMITDDRFGDANPLPEAAKSLRRALSRSTRLPVVTGFIGKSRSGEITTLGRNGSDYTAAILGAALGCREIQIWSDTDGIMTADPRVVPEARPLASLSFAEASELAHYGGKVLHPHTLVPAIAKGIPIRVLNSFEPDHPGTVILARRPERALGVQSIAFKRRQAIVSATSPRMAVGPGFLARIFAAFAAHQVDVDMVSTSEVTVSASVSGTARLDGAVAALRREFQVRLARERSVVCVVGEGIASTPGVAGLVFGALKEARVNVEMISQGASEINIALVVKDRDLERCVRALHARLFP
jgi:aspartate kinase